MANTNKPGTAGVRPVAGSANNVTQMTPQQQQQLIAQQGSAPGARPREVTPQMHAQQQQILMMQVQQHVLLQQQAAAVAAAGRAPSPAGQPATNSTSSGGNKAVPSVIQMPFRVPGTGQLAYQPVQLPMEFIGAKRDFLMQNANNHTKIYQEYVVWDQQRRAAAAGGSSVPAAKRPKMEPVPVARPGAVPLMLQQQQQQQQILAAMVAAGGRPPLHPGMAMPGMMAPHLTAAQASAAAQQRLQSSNLQRRAQFTPIMRPATEDEKQFVPRPRLQALVKQVGQGMQIASAKATEEAEEALRSVAEDFISGAVSFAVAMARRRKAQEVEPADLLLYLERTWHIQVPGFQSRDVKPYTRRQPSADHQRRMAAVRKTMASAASSKEGAGAASPAAPVGAGALPAVGGIASPAANGSAPSSAAAAGAAGGNTAATAGVGGAAGADTSPAGGKKAPPGKQQQHPQEDAAVGDDMPDVDAAAANGQP